MDDKQSETEFSKTYSTLEVFILSTALWLLMLIVVDQRKNWLPIDHLTIQPSILRKDIFSYKVALSTREKREKSWISKDITLAIQMTKLSLNNPFSNAHRTQGLSFYSVF